MDDTERPKSTSNIHYNPTAIPPEILKQIAIKVLDEGYERPEFHFDSMEDGRRMASELYQSTLRYIAHRRTDIVNRKIVEVGNLINSDKKCRLILGLSILYDITQDRYKLLPPRDSE